MSQYQIKIEEPCHENWNAMTPKEKGRFCGVCTKEVVDFTSMNDEEVKSYFVNYKGGLCGRFNKSQLEKKDERYYKLPEYTKKFKRAFALVFLMFSACESKAQHEPDIMGDIAVEMPANKMNTGIVFGADGRGIQGARITFYKQGVFVKRVTTSENGNYKVALPYGTYNVYISREGYKRLHEKIEVSAQSTLGDFEMAQLESSLREPPRKGRVLMGKPAYKPE